MATRKIPSLATARHWQAFRLLSAPGLGWCVMHTSPCCTERGILALGRNGNPQPARWIANAVHVPADAI